MGRKELFLGITVVSAAATGGYLLANSQKDTSTQEKLVVVTATEPPPTGAFATSTVASTETQVPTNTIQLNTPIGAITATIAPRPTETLTVPTMAPTETRTPQEERQEVLGVNELTNWDAAASLPKDITEAGYHMWLGRMADLETRGIIKTGDNRTYDKIKELKSVGTSFEFVKDDTKTFPKAKEVVAQAGNMGQQVLLKLGYQKINDSTARTLGLKIIDQTANRSADGKKFFTRNTYPATVPGVDRADQKEPEICSMYIPGIQIGHERKSGGILLESNEAAWNFTFNITPNGFKSNYPDLRTLRIKDAQGKVQTLSWRAFDMGSQPNAEAEMTPPENFGDFVWGSEIKWHCGEAVPAKKEAKPVQKAAPVTGPQINPTAVPTSVILPSPVPTNEHRDDQPPAVTPIPRTTPTPIPVTGVVVGLGGAYVARKGRERFNRRGGRGR